MSSAGVTVIIPAFNGERWVAEAIDSALAQTVPPLEVIVVDDGSTDATAAVLAGYGGRIRAITQPNQGVAAARNTGLRAARGGTIAFLDADDAWHPRKLELQLRILSEQPRLGLLGTRIFNWPAATLPATADNSHPPVTGLSREQLVVKNYLVASSVVLRRDVAREVGDFDTRLNGAEDHDYWLRAAEVCAVANLDVPLTGYRSVAGSLSRRPGAMEADMRWILSKLDARDAWRGDRLLRRRAYSYLHFSAAHLYGASGRHAAAAARVLQSLAWYPLPFGAAEAGVPLARPKRLAVLLLRLLGVMSPDPGC